MSLTPIRPESVERITALVIGPAGIGKTSLLRTIPEEEKACTLSAEAGLLCVRDLVQEGRVEGYEIKSLQDFREAFQLLAHNQEMKDRYQWVFIDSLTEISARCVEHFKDLYPDKGDSFKLWGDYTDTLVSLIKGFRDLASYNVVFTCLEQIEKDDANRRYIGPATAGKQVKELLTSFFDEVFYMTAFSDDEGQAYRSSVTQPWERRPGKDRSGKLEMIEKPDLKIIKSKILNGGKDNGAA